MQQLSFLPGAMTPGERNLIQRALKTLDRHLHEPGVAFTSTRAAREWLILNMAGLEREETPGERNLIQRALKTLDRHLHEPGVAFTSTRAAREWLILNMAGLEREEFRVLYLNGIAACLMTYSHHACRTENYAMTVQYYRLRDYALQHPECSAIMRIID